MWSFPGTYANRGSGTEQASSDVAKGCYFNKIGIIVIFATLRRCMRGCAGRALYTSWRCRVQSIYSLAF